MWIAMEANNLGTDIGVIDVSVTKEDAVASAQKAYEEVLRNCGTSVQEADFNEEFGAGSVRTRNEDIYYWDVKEIETREHELLNAIVSNLLVSEYTLTVIKYLLDLGFEEEDLLDLDFTECDIESAREELKEDEGPFSPVFF